MTTDLERMRDALEWHEYGNQDERRRLAFIELDAHLKEDAERDYRISFLENMYLEERSYEVENRTLQAELARLREESKYNYDDSEKWRARYTELLEAVKDSMPVIEYAEDRYTELLEAVKDHLEGGGNCNKFRLRRLIEEANRDQS